MQYQEFINQGYIYLYRGDRLTDVKYKMQPCLSVLSNKGKCIRGKNGNMLVSFSSGSCNVLARQLRRLDKLVLKETGRSDEHPKQVISKQLDLHF